VSETDSSRDRAAEDEARPSYDRVKYGTNRQELTELGERAVRDALNTGKYGHPGTDSHAYVSAWLSDAAFARETASSGARDQREVAMLEEAREANRLALVANAAAIAAGLAASESNTIARSNRRIAVCAIIIAALTAIVVAVIQAFGGKS
jgi:hypothetical protein